MTIDHHIIQCSWSATVSQSCLDNNVPVVILKSMLRRNIWIIFASGYFPGILVTATSLVTKPSVRMDSILIDQNYSYGMQIWKSIHGLDVL